MKTLVIDSTELRRDWTLKGLTAQLLGHAVDQNLLSVFVPASVVEEHIANHSRAVADSLRGLEKIELELHRLGLVSNLVKQLVDFDYRSYLLERFDEVLGFYVAEWPKVEHPALVARAVGRVSPFDAKGGGYRDSLVWASAMELAAAGRQVALVSADRAFGDNNGSLAADLKREAGEASLQIELVQDLVPWLLKTLPWRAENLGGAVEAAQDEAFWRYLAESDIQEYFAPRAEDMGFDRPPYHFDVDEVQWGGDLRRVRTRRGNEDVFVVEYDIDQVVSFEAELPDNSRLEKSWEATSQGYAGRTFVRGETGLVARLVVLFDADMHMSVDQLFWNRPDGTPPGPGVPESDPNLRALFDLE